MKRKVLVVNGLSYAYSLRNLDLDFTGNTSLFFDNPEEFSLVLFTGGEDVNPRLYGEKSPKGICWFSPHRDEFESRVYQVALKHEIKMTGICRGVQFLNVMNGGKMIHHLDGHAGTVHEMETATGKRILVNSLHHQMCIPGPGAIVVGWSRFNLSDIYIGDNDEVVDYNGNETEALIYPETNCAGVQYHPEMLQDSSEGFVWYETFIYNFLNMEMADFVRHYSNKEMERNDRSLVVLR